jgi:hypothetical protein
VKTSVDSRRDMALYATGKCGGGASTMNPNAKRRSRAMEQTSGTLSASLGEPIDGTATESLSLIPRDPAADNGFPRDQLLSKLKRECEVVLELRLQHNHSGQHPQGAVDRHILLLVPSRPRTE